MTDLNVLLRDFNITEDAYRAAHGIAGLLPLSYAHPGAIGPDVDPIRRYNPLFPLTPRVVKRGGKVKEVEERTVVFAWHDCRGCGAEIRWSYTKCWDCRKKEADKKRAEDTDIV